MANSTLNAATENLESERLDLHEEPVDCFGTNDEFSRLSPSRNYYIIIILTTNQLMMIMKRLKVRMINHRHLSSKALIASLARLHNA